MEVYIGYNKKRIIFVSECETTSDCSILKYNTEVPFQTLVENYEIRRGNLMEKNKYTAENLRVAFVSVYGINCGISTYAEALIPTIGSKVKEYKIFAEYADNAPEDPNVIRCWKRGESLIKLADEIHSYSPDIVYLNHEYGIWPVASHWLAFISEMQQYKTYTILHSVYHHKDKLICEAGLKNIVVHTETAKKVLVEEKKVTGKVEIIPHFCIPCKDSSKYWNLYSTKHTLFQLGFGFRYKGWQTALEVVAKLKEKYPDIFYTGIFSEGAFSKTIHDEYFEELSKKTVDLGIRENVAILRGYQSDEVIDAFLRTNQVAIFPYKLDPEHINYGVSGAARLAMRTGIPTVVSNASLFDDLDSVCSRSGSVDDFVKEITKLFESKEEYELQQERQNEFLIKNSIENIANQYIKLITS